MTIHPELMNSNARVVFFPVRHHSPLGARLVRDLIREMRPDAILIEGPADYNPQLSEIYLGHRLPIAIYSFVRLQSGHRLGAFYPFCIYSPEWQALQTGHELGADVQFIDMPWAELATMETEEIPTHRYADAQLEESNYIDMLCREVGVDNFDALWDKLFEVDSALTPATYLQRGNLFMYHLRQTARHIRQSDIAREAFMIQQIRQAMDKHKGRILVVTGGFHSSALFERLQDEPQPDEEAYTPVALDRGIALTPYSYQRLDNLVGYESGMPNPGFYHHVWLNAEAGNQDTHRHLLRLTAQMLRERKQSVTAADLIAVDTTAHALATLRGHKQIWRRDLIDGIISALVKDELAYDFRHPFLEAIHELFRGSERGKLAEGTAVPPLAEQIEQTLQSYDLYPEQKAKEVKLDLMQETNRQKIDLEKSRVLHQLRVLGVPGFQRTSRPTTATDTDETRETWRIIWSPEFHSAVIESSIYGATLVDAARAKLHESLAAIENPNAEQASTVLLDAALMGMPENKNFYAGLVDIINGDNSYFTVTSALDNLLFLYRFDLVLGTSKHTDVLKLLQTAFGRGLWLLENLGVVQDKDEELLKGLKALLQTFERCEADLATPRADFARIFADISHDDGQTPIMRGASSGVLLVIGEADVHAILLDLRYFADPEQLGDYLTGLFYIGREVFQRHKELLERIDELLCNYSDNDFLVAVPSLRLAFSFFTPREKHHIAHQLFEGAAVSPMDILQVDVKSAYQVLQFETHLFNQLAKYGLVANNDEALKNDTS